MHYEQYYQIATKQRYLDSGVSESDLATCRTIKQANKVYPNMRNCGDFTVETGMLIRHLEFSNGYMQQMWAEAVATQDCSLIPFKKEELELILANEPQEDV